MNRHVKHRSRSGEEPALPSVRPADLGPMVEARPATLHGEVLSKLRDYIVVGPLSEGARIPERQLCELFGISRTPLREALKVLASEGLIDLLPNRGARVRTHSEQDIRELFDLMAGLEALAGRLACEFITDEEVAEIERLHHEMYAFYLRKEADGYYRANQTIHTKIVEASRNAALSMAYASFTGRMRRIRYSTNQARRQERWAEAMREHEAILDALRRRAGSEVSELLFMHLRQKQAAAIAHWKESK